MEANSSPAGSEAASLVARVKEGDREAFMTITRLYQQKVFQLAYAFFRNHEDAMDIVQETFLRFYQKIDLYQQEKNFQNWLLQIARNLCIDHYRKNRKKASEHGPALNVDDLNLADGSSHHFGKASDLKEIFSRCLKQLTERQRMIFVMKHINQLKYTEIAQILDVAVGTVKSLNFKAIQNLRTLMSPYLES